MRRVVALARRDRMSIATKTLYSNGVAPPTEDTADLMEKMHLDYNSELKTHDPGPHQLSIDIKECATALVSASGKRPTQPDPFGWTNDMLWPFRPAKRKEHHPFILALARLQVLLAKGDVPMALRILPTTGKLTVLNKVPHEENLKRVQQGLDPKQRPVNSGSELLKVPLRLASRSPSGKRVRHELELAGQLGLGASSGPERIALTAAAHHLDGGLLSKEDGVNAFNAIKRQAILDGVNTLWPEANAIASAYYGIPSIALYHYVKNGKHYVRIILGKEGVRMGCVLGSTGFEVNILAELRDDFPDVYVPALTDDVIPHFTGRRRDLERRLRQARPLLESLRRAGAARLKRAPEKGKILLPANAPVPSGDVANSLSPIADGIMEAGAPIVLSSSPAMRTSSWTKPPTGLMTL